MYKTKEDNPGIPAGLIKRPLGQILIDGKFISPADLKRALEEQKSSNELLGEILVRLGVLDPVELEVALSVQRDLACFKDAVKLAAGVHCVLEYLFPTSRCLSREQLEIALKEQKRTGEKLGEILLRQGLLTQNELETLLELQRHQASGTSLPTRLRLGELLVASKYITREQLEDALERQKTSKKKLGELLIEAGYAEPHHVEHGFKLQQMLVAAALAAAVSLAPVSTTIPSAEARSVGARVTVSATVLGRASLNVLYQTPELVVTNSDVARGYVDVISATQIEIKSNISSGFLLTFENNGFPFKEAHISLNGEEIIIGSSGGIIARPYKGNVIMQLSYRFIFDENVQPGTYGWPISISISPR